MNIDTRKFLVSLCANVALAVGAAAEMNGLIFLLQWDVSKPGAGAGAGSELSGYLIATVWLMLFALMGGSRALVSRASTVSAKRHARLIGLLLVLCWVYPLYTFGLSNQIIGLIGNFVTLMIAGWVVLQIRQTSKLAARLLWPLLIWLSLATAFETNDLRLLPQCFHRLAG